MKEFLKRPHHTWLPALVCGALGTLVGFGVATLFPAGDISIYDWRVGQYTSVPRANPSIILITLEKNGPASCGDGRWKTPVVAQAISALTQAQAKVIAPAIKIGTLPSPECGDIAGLAKLIEATKQAGNVVYPASVPEALVIEAKLTGVLDLKPDQDGIFRRTSLNSLGPRSEKLPFGLAVAVASTAGLGTTPVTIPAKEGLLAFVGRWTDRPYQTYSFRHIWDLITSRDQAKLSAHVKDKLVILFPIGTHAETLTTPLEIAAPVGFLHANLLDGALSRSWFTMVSYETGLAMTLILAVVAAWVSLRFVGVRSLIGVILLIAGYWALTQVFFQTLEQVWPVIAPLVALLVAPAGAVLWHGYQGHARIGEQIKRVSAQLAENHKQLVKKELLAEQLNGELTRARELADQSTQRYEEVAASVEEHRSRLCTARQEVDATRQRLQELQSQLNDLKKNLPSQPPARDPLLENDLAPLRQECESLGIFTHSTQVLKVFLDLKKAAITKSPILLLGETGTGKELFAQAAHRLSNRSHGPFISINMAAIRPELFESELFGSVKGAYTGAIGRRGFLETADGGTLFLDEVGELSPSLQAKLLRVLEDGSFYRVGQSSPTKVDVRLVTATNRDLVQEVNNGRYREDLYYRLRSIVLRLPALRERGAEDLDFLARHFVRELAQGHPKKPLQFSQSALEAIHAYSWPGNIRELRQTVAQAVALCDKPVLTENDLRLSDSQQSMGSFTSFEAPEFSTGGKEDWASRADTDILSCLRYHKFDMQATAKALNLDRGTITQRLKGIGFQSIVEHQENIPAAAEALAGTTSLVKVVESKLREYYNNLVCSATQFESVDLAIADSRRRLRNLPDRHFPAVETLIRQHFLRHKQ